MPRKSQNGSGAKRPGRDELLWLETYFIVFPHRRRPTLGQVERALADADPHLRLENLAADDDGMFQSLLVQSAEDHAAVEVSYETGEAVVEQNLAWAKQLKNQLSPNQLQQLMSADARLDVAHFERLQSGEGEAASSDSHNKPTPGVGHMLSPQRDDDRAKLFASDDFEDDEFGADDSADDDIDEEAALEIFDPTCLLTVVESLSMLTKGLTFDPAAGEVM